uniref:Uncharacterized protein n=1 Tax=Solanum lycopersicum TaxID=4081 RepID=A0A3Q7FAA2_SOLLC
MIYRWSKIAKHLPGRTDNEIKNLWRTRIQKHIKQAENINRLSSNISENNNIQQAKYSRKVSSFSLHAMHDL